MCGELLEEAKTMEADLITWKRKFHTMPELGPELPDTGMFVREKLGEMGISYEIKVNGSCVVGTLGKGNGRFMLHNDMDGLPSQEESGEEFASQNGRIRACGHDLYTTVLSGAARLLKQHESELKGQVELLFQPREETFQEAGVVAEEGVLNHPKVGNTLAMHMVTQIPPEYVAYGSLPMVGVYGFKITLIGQGGYGSRSEKCIDPINTGVHVYLMLQELIVRECPAISEAALTIRQFYAGSISNVIPETAVLQGTMRGFDEKTMSRLIVWLNETVPSVAGAYRTKAEIEVVSDIPIVRCSKELNQEIAERLKELEPELKVACAYHVMGSEDFAYISQKIPAGYVCIGAGIEDVPKRYMKHNLKMHFHESALVKGTTIYVGTTMRWPDLHGNQ